MKPYKPCHQGHPRWTGHNGEFWQNVAHRRREWQTTPVLLPWEPHEQHEKAKTPEDEALKSFKLGFSSTKTKNFQMEKLGLEKAEEPEIKLPTSTVS